MQKKIIWGGILLALIIALSFGLLVKKQKYYEAGSTASYSQKMMDGGNYLEEEAMRDDFGMATTRLAANDDMIAPAPDYGESASGDTTVGQERMIIKTGQMAMVVEEVPLALEQIEQFVVKNGGFVVSSNAYNAGISPSADITVRIPVEIFDTGMEDLEAIGKVESKSVTGQDVTEEFVDIEAQITNLRRAEAQFAEIMSRAVKIEDVLAVQRELTNVRNQIERLQGRMNYLSKSAKLSTLTIHLATNPDTLPVLDENTWKPLADAKDAFRSLIELGQGFVSLLIWAAIYIPVWVIIFFVGRLVYKKGSKLFNK